MRSQSYGDSWRRMIRWRRIASRGGWNPRRLDTLWLKRSIKMVSGVNRCEKVKITAASTDSSDKEIWIGSVLTEPEPRADNWELRWMGVVERTLEAEPFFKGLLWLKGLDFFATACDRGGKAKITTILHDEQKLKCIHLKRNIRES